MKKFLSILALAALGAAGLFAQIKPEMSDTISGSIYADNWFSLFVNGKLVAVDSIDFLPHNVVTLDLLPEYPMTIAIIAKDNADVKNGMEYGDHIGDGGFILKFSDGTVTSASWKVFTVFKGPLNKDTKNPQVTYTALPEGWQKPGFNDTAWPSATVYSQQRISPKKPFFDHDFSGALWIWSSELDLDNTVLFRTVVTKPGATKRWTTVPDLDVSGAPLK